MKKALLKKLHEEKSRLETELGKIGALTGGKPNTETEIWEAKKTIEIDTADDTELADSFEELSTNEGIISSLELQLRDVDIALEKVENDAYGICEKCNKKIEEDRLEANPAARTCKEHMNG